jgi:hypothetical protein
MFTTSVNLYYCAHNTTHCTTTRHTLHCITHHTPHHTTHTIPYHRQATSIVGSFKPVGRINTQRKRAIRTDKGDATHTRACVHDLRSSQGGYACKKNTEALEPFKRLKRVTTQQIWVGTTAASCFSRTLPPVAVCTSSALHGRQWCTSTLGQRAHHLLHAAGGSGAALCALCALYIIVKAADSSQRLSAIIKVGESDVRRHSC